MTKILCDIAEIKTIKEFNKKKIVKGFTTNPSLMRKAGAKDYKSYSKKILKICKKKPVSLEVFADEYTEMKKQAIKINSWGKNVFVKVPVINSKGKFMGRIIKELNSLNIKLNITAVYNFKQLEKILNLINKKTKVIISIFAGRSADTGKDPVPEIKKTIALSKKFKNVEILWASTREPYNYLQAKQLKCHIITVPPNIISKIELFGKSYKKLTLETVKGFLIDSRKSNFKIWLSEKKFFIFTNNIFFLIILFELGSRLIVYSASKDINIFFYVFKKNISFQIRELSNLNFEIIDYEVKPINNLQKKNNFNKTNLWAFGGSSSDIACKKNNNTSWPSELENINNKYIVKNFARSGTNSDFALNSLLSNLYSNKKETPDIILWANYVNETDVLTFGFKNNKNLENKIKIDKVKNTFLHLKSISISFENKRCFGLFKELYWHY